MHSLFHEHYARAVAAERLAARAQRRRLSFWRQSTPPPPPPRPPGRGGGISWRVPATANACSGAAARIVQMS
jgi:hypothetical protein